ncbi:MAG TPA: GIY-YIG nuclease family protein [Allosphingosinicella sp.]|jgi:hypothetical protein
MRDHIIAEIRRLAELNGQPPGQTLFARETGIPPYQWLGKFWARWGDALAEAGYKPNAWNARLDSNEVLTAVIAACRHFGRVPTRPEFILYRQTHPSLPSEQAIKRHFGRRVDLIAALAKRAAEDEEYHDIATMLPNVASAEAIRVPATQSREGFVYLIRSGDFYKIGRSDELERRVKQIRIALPDRAELVHSIRTDDPSGIEAYWHRRFADKRANGEWFRLAGSDVAAFKKRKFQ